jgi:hypothetical protein
LQASVCLSGPVRDSCPRLGCMLQAAEFIIDLAQASGKPFAIVPCCVYSAAFPGRCLPDGRPVKKYDDLIDYLVSRNPGRIKVADLQFEGRNKVGNHVLATHACSVTKSLCCLVWRECDYCACCLCMCCADLCGVNVSFARFVCPWCRSFIAPAGRTEQRTNGRASLCGSVGVDVSRLRDGSREPFVQTSGMIRLGCA